MPFTPLQALNGTQSMTSEMSRMRKRMTSPGDLPIMCFLAYFGIVALCHFFNRPRPRDRSRDRLGADGWQATHWSDT